MTETLRFLSVLIAGGWFGAMILFAFVVAPTAFGVLPGAEVAGSLVGPVLRAIHLFGIAAGVVLAACAWQLDRARWLRFFPLVLAAASAYSEFVVTGEISGLLPHDAEAGRTPDQAARFAFLHQLSMVIFTGVGLGAAALVFGHVWADRTGSGRWG